MIISEDLFTSGLYTVKFECGYELNIHAKDTSCASNIAKLEHNKKCKKCKPNKAISHKDDTNEQG